MAAVGSQAWYNGGAQLFVRRGWRSVTASGTVGRGGVAHLAASAPAAMPFDLFRHVPEAPTQPPAGPPARPFDVADLYREPGAAPAADGRPCAPGERGEVTVTGGRNPLLRLVRYRTGDRGALAFEACPCGDSAPRLVGLEGRAPVVFRAADGSVVNPVDVSRVLRPFPLVQHQLTQHAGGAFTLILRPTTAGVDVATVEASLRVLIGAADLRTETVGEIEGTGPGGKVVPYVQEGE